MSFYVKSNKNKYNIDVVFSYSENEFQGYDYKFEIEPRLGQYIINNQLVADDKYDELIAPIIAAKEDDNLGVVEEVIISEAAPVIPTEEAPVQEYWKTDVSAEALDGYTEKANSLQKLITYASNPAHINSDNKLVMSIFIRSGEQRDTPLIIDILDPSNNINTVTDYINMLTEQKNESTNVIIPWLTQELAKKK